VIDILRFALLEVGIVYFLTMSAIFSAPRRLIARLPVLLALIYCPSCTGFWVGVLLYIAGFYPFAAHDALQGGACAGFIGMAIANAWHLALYQGSNYAYDDEQQPPQQEAQSAETKETLPHE